MKTYIKLVFFAFLSSFIVNAYSQAPTFIAAADLTYRFNGSFKYLVTLDVFAECGSQFGNLDSWQQYDIVVSSKSQNTSFIIKVVKSDANKEGEIVRIFCEDQPTICEESNGDRGLKKYKFTGNVDLSTLPRANDWILSWQFPARSFELNNTLLNVDLENYYVDALINTEVSGINSSPRFSNNPIIKSCVGELENYNLGATDTDGDNLTYSIQSPRTSADDEIFYGNGFSALQPVSTSQNIQLSQEGTLSITPNSPNQSGITDVMIEERRDGVLIGRVRRGIHIVTFDCENERPVFTGWNDSGDTLLNICVGDTLTRGSINPEVRPFGFIRGTDQDGDDVFFKNITVTKNGLNANLPFSLSGVGDTTALFINKNTFSADTGTYVIEITLEDKGCPTSRAITQKFYLKINPIPDFSLGKSHIFACNTPELINPVITSPNGPFSYEWTNFTTANIVVQEDGDHIIQGDLLSTDPSFLASKTGQYALKVTDAIGCYKIDSLILRESLFANYVWDTFCFGLPTYTYNTSIAIESEIVDARWTFIDDNQTFNLQGDTVIHTFSDSISYDVRLIVENNLGCTDTIVQTIQICANKTPSFVIAGHCSNTDRPITALDPKGIEFIDITNYKFGCGPIGGRLIIVDSTGTKGNVIFDSIPGRIDTLPNNFPRKHISVLDSGFYHAFWIIESEAHCIDTAYQTFTVDPRPQIDLLTDRFFSINCDNPDTVLTAIVNPNNQGTPPLLYNTSPFDVNDTLKIDARETGTYLFNVLDDLGCRYKDSVVIQFTVQADFVYDTVCSLGDVMQFTDSSTGAFPIVSWKWNFGDNTMSNLQNPGHIYNTAQDFLVELLATDSTGCTASKKIEVINTFPVDTFYITPDLTTQSICLADLVRGFTAFPNPTTGSHIDTIYWNFGDGTEATYAGQTIDLGYEETHIFRELDTLNITNYVIYNKNPFFPDRYCRIDNELDAPIELSPEFNGAIADNRTCFGDSAVFIFERTINDSIPVTSYSWSITPAATFNPIETSTDSVPVILIDERFNTNINYRVNLRVRDVNNCVKDLVKDFTIDSVTKVNIAFENGCPNEEIDFTLTAPDSWARTQPFTYFFLDRGIDKIIVDTTSFRPAASTLELIQTGYTFGRSGEIPIRVVVLKNAFVNKECRSITDTTITLYEAPKINFFADTVCAGYEMTQFTNLTTIDGDFEIESYNWDFGDSTTSEEENPSHIFKIGGPQRVTLTAVSDSGCASSATQDTIYVKYQPIAKFFIEPTIPEANIPLFLIDDSDPGATGSLVDSWYIMGDGSDTIFEFDPVHTYDEIEVYFVDHAVSNTEGCWDTTTVRTDLNVYLDLPNAFSPNSDFNNDELGLIHKSIRELQEFKIYNRWGELVFDGNNDLNATWDGTYNGKEQPVGVFVAHIKALGAYGKLFNFKKNVTLIR